jgi:hypothetical protein
MSSLLAALLLVDNDLDGKLLDDDSEEQGASAAATRGPAPVLLRA